MTETHELNRPVICLRYAARGVGIRGVAHPVKPANGFRLPIPSASTAQDYQLSVAGALRQSTGVVSDSFFESDRMASEAVGSVVYDEIQLKRTAQTKQLYRRERR